MIYGEGISHLSEVVNLGVELEIIDKSGAWFSYKGEKIGQGVLAVREYLKNNPAVEEEITAQIREKLFASQKKEDDAPAAAAEPKKEPAAKDSKDKK